MYGKYVHIKGVSIKWSGQNIFPQYPSTSGSFVSQRRINKLKPLAIRILTEGKEQILKVFTNFLQRKYHGMVKVSFDLAFAIDRIHTTKVHTYKKGDVFGECDENKIFIAKEKMNDSYLLGTMLHEALHYSCKCNNKYICEEDEHRIFNLVGDDV
tara:strand:- start:269 stop:733 length:465 start_codon:yes stop_codon:yes gene_type:complete